VAHAVTTPFFPAGAHGGDGARLAQRLGVDPASVLDLSASTNPLAPDVAPLVAKYADAAREYPDDGAVRAALARTFGVDAERVVVTNGGAEAIALVADLRPRGWVDEPDFSLYARHLRELAPGAPRWRSNPHNPTGVLASADDDAAVWDEAFYPLATGTWTRGDSDRGAIVVGSLTKVFACPGLRVGYVLAPDEAFARDVVRRRPEWSVNSLGCAIAPALLDDAPLAVWARGIRVLRERLTELLRANSLQPGPSDANYVLVQDAHGLRDHLARRAVLVRDTASFGWPDGVRVAVPDDAGLDQLARALEGWER
jgi:histidinol-phosphate/aromatic aminotransferase/cobyric acid decarboxylase-like protein